MTYAGVLPYAIHGGKTYYLIGKEHAEKGWDGSKKWSDFGGDTEGENPLMAAARELYEETMGFFGTVTSIKKGLKKNRRINVPGGYTFLFEIDYDPFIPELFERVHRYFTQCAKPHDYKRGYMAIPSCPDGLFEKTDIRWITETELKKAVRTRSKQFRWQFLQSLGHIL